MEMAVKNLARVDGLQSGCRAAGSATWIVRAALIWGTVTCSSKALVWCDIGQGIVGSIRLGGQQTLLAKWYLALTADVKKSSQPVRVLVPQEISYGEMENCS
jgi:hypothetical protein